MKKEAYYFSHDSNAKDDPKILQLRMEMGWEGYGLFWALIEMLRNESDHRMQKHYKSIAFALHTNEESIKKLVNDFDLFVTDDQFFWSESLLKRMELKEAKSEKMRNAANKRWNKDDDAQAMQMHSISNAEAMQLKERKGKETKGNLLTEESHNEIFRQLWKSNIWLEGIAVKNKAKKEQVLNHLNEFRLECILKDELKVDEKDAKNHFINWIKRGNPIPEKKAGETTYAKSTIEDNWW
jgi:hypothetical protein